jgi:REP element-mobilizing transposase RayT
MRQMMYGDESQPKRRKQLRLKKYEYALPGGYFITICTFQRDCLFGEIVSGEIKLNAYGEVVKEEWIKTGTIRKEVSIDKFIEMPNHVHGILFIKDAVGADGVRPEKKINRVHRRAPLRGKSKLLGFDIMVDVCSNDWKMGNVSHLVDIGEIHDACHPQQNHMLK